MDGVYSMSSEDTGIMKVNVLMNRHEHGRDVPLRRMNSRSIGYYLAVGMVFICLALVAIQPVCAYDLQNTAVMRDWGKQLTADHPEVKTMSDLEKAKFAFSEYSSVLFNKNVPLNSNLAGRVHGGDYTCGWHTNNLEAVFRTLGIKEVHSITADKNSYNILDVNRNHQAVMVIIDGKPYVFDIWKMAVDNNGEYKDAAAPLDPYNGMPLDEWNANMKDESYVRFTADTENVEDGQEVWDPSALLAESRLPLSTSGTVATPTPAFTISPTATPGFGNGLRMLTITSQDVGYETKPFTISAGYKATGFKVTYDFSSAKPAFGAYFQVGIQSSEKTFWSTQLMGEGWGSSSGATKTVGSLDNLILPPGDYNFAAYQHLTSPSDSTTPIPATLTFTVTGSGAT